MITRSIGSWTHGIIDYATVILLAAGPRMAGFNGKQATFCYILAAVHLVLTLVTRFPFAPFRIVRFPLHGAIELIVSVVLVALPWLAEFARGVKSRNFFVSIGILIFLIWLLTDYRGLRDRVATV